MGSILVDCSTLNATALQVPEAAEACWTYIPMLRKTIDQTEMRKSFQSPPQHFTIARRNKRKRQ